MGCRNMNFENFDIQEPRYCKDKILINVFFFYETHFINSPFSPNVSIGIIRSLSIVSFKCLDWYNKFCRHKFSHVSIGIISSLGIFMLSPNCFLRLFIHIFRCVSISSTRSVSNSLSQAVSLN